MSTNYRKAEKIFIFPTGSAHNVETTSIQRQDVESTFFQRCVRVGL